VAAGGRFPRSSRRGWTVLEGRLVGDCGLQSPAGGGQMLASGNRQPASTASFVQVRGDQLDQGQQDVSRSRRMPAGIEQFPARSDLRTGSRTTATGWMIVMCLSKFIQIIADAVYVIYVRYHADLDAFGG